MSEYDIPSLIREAKAAGIGEALAVLVSLPYCRISLVARDDEGGCSLFIEAVVRYVPELSPADLRSRRVLVRRLRSLRFQLVHENGNMVYELGVVEMDMVRLMEGLKKGFNWS